MFHWRQRQQNEFEQLRVSVHVIVCAQFNSCCRRHRLVHWYISIYACIKVHCLQLAGFKVHIAISQQQKKKQSETKLLSKLLRLGIYCCSGQLKNWWWYEKTKWIYRYKFSFFNDCYPVPAVLFSQLKHLFDFHCVTQIKLQTRQYVDCHRPHKIVAMSSASKRKHKI